MEIILLNKTCWHHHHVFVTSSFLQHSEIQRKATFSRGNPLLVPPTIIPPHCPSHTVCGVSCSIERSASAWPVRAPTSASCGGPSLRPSSSSSPASGRWSTSRASLRPRSWSEVCLHLRSSWTDSSGWRDARPKTSRRTHVVKGELWLLEGGLYGALLHSQCTVYRWMMPPVRRNTLE